jgi:tRNA(fMet)-specific endonuclease VapC
MPFLLDTNIVIALVNGTSAAAQTRLRQVHNRGHAVYISSVVLFEMRFGAERSGNPARNHGFLDNFLAATPLVGADFDPDDASEAGRIRSELARAATPIGPYDVLFAAQARARGLTAVTDNLREFQCVSGLAVENWL